MNQRKQKNKNQSGSKQSGQKGSKNHSQNKKNNSRRRRSNNKQNNKKEIKWTDKVSEHFSKKDFTCKESGQLKLSLGLVGALELIQAKTQKQVTILKGFESLEVAEKRHDFKRNFHTQGLAADIQVEDIEPKELFAMAEEIDEIKGIGLNIDDNYVHVDVRKEDERTLWVETKNDKIDITEKNRSKYL